MKKFKKSIFLFRRDLRVQDNTGLINACKLSSEVIPCFVLDLGLLKDNDKISKYRLNFLKECLLDLNNQLKKKKSYLHIFLGKPEKITKSLILEESPDAIFLNRDYTPYSGKRDKKISEICVQKNVKIIASDDALLRDIDEVKTNKGEPYKVFTAFFSKAKEIPVRKPQSHSFQNLSSRHIHLEIAHEELSKYLGKMNGSINFRGGRESCKKILENLKNLKNYEFERNFPILNKTSHLSAHNKFGTCSIREIYYKIRQELGPDHTLIAEIHWRDFFTYIMYHFPHSRNNEFNEKYKKIPWSRNKKTFSKWCQGKTGFPIVDAGMRELNETGFMHNRVRMIVASFLTKDLHIDWRWGEKYFASKLIDYDPSVNVGNWQWAASTGCDAQPWFRIFNPWLQQQKFDVDCKYIKKWIPELKNTPAKIIHKLNMKSIEVNTKYSKPIVEHKLESSYTKEIFKNM